MFVELIKPVESLEAEGNASLSFQIEGVEVADLPEGEQLLNKEISIEELVQHLQQLSALSSEDQTSITPEPVSLYMLPTSIPTMQKVEISLPAIVAFRLIADALRERYAESGYQVRLR